MVLATGIEVVSDQVCFSLLDRRAAGPLSDVCRARGVKLLAYGTLAGGWLSDRWLGRPEPDWEREGTWSQMKYGRFMRVAGGWDALQRVLRAADAVARRHGVSIANVASRWVLEQPAVAGVIIGARPGEREHIADNLRVFSFALTARGSRGAAGGARHSHPDPRRLRRRVPQAAVPHRVRRPEPSRGVVPGALRGAAPRRRPRALPERHAVGEPRRLLPRDAARHARARLGDDGDARRSRRSAARIRAAQTHFAIDKIEGALQSLGARLEDVVRTRVFVKRLDDWEAVGPRARRAIRPHPARQHARRRVPRGRRVPRRGRGGRGGVERVNASAALRDVEDDGARPAGAPTADAASRRARNVCSCATTAAPRRSRRRHVSPTRSERRRSRRCHRRRSPAAVGARSCDRLRPSR